MMIALYILFPIIPGDHSIFIVIHNSKKFQGLLFGNIDWNLFTGIPNIVAIKYIGFFIDESAEGEECLSWIKVVIADPFF